MSRWSPTVLPTAAPSVFQHLSDALAQGVQTKHQFDQQRIADEDHAMRLKQIKDAEGRQTDEDAIHGIHPAGWTPPGAGGLVAGGPIGQAAGQDVVGSPTFTGEDHGGLAAALAQSPTAMQPPAPQSSSGHPGGWDVNTKQFVRAQRLPTQVLPSGRVYDPQQALDERLAPIMAERELAQQQQEAERQRAINERRTALRGLMGQKGYQNLSEAMIESGAQNAEVFKHLVENKQEEYKPQSFEERVRLAREEAEARARAEARFRQAPAPQIYEGSGGPLLVDTRGGTARPLVGPDGKPLGPKAANHAPSDGQIQSSMMAARMENAEKTLAEHEAKGVPNKRTATAGAVPLAGHWLQNQVMSNDQQLYRQAQEDWVRAKLRKESGAAIGKTEMEDEIRTYFPQVGDTPDMVKQKAASRKEAADLMKVSGGNAAQMFDKPENPWAGTPPSTAGAAASGMAKRPSLAERIAELKSQNVSKDDARATLLREGYELARKP